MSLTQTKILPDKTRLWSVEFQDEADKTRFMNIRTYTFEAALAGFRQLRANAVIIAISGK